MHKIIASLLLLFLSAGSYAQNKASIKGTLADSASKAPLEYATVAVVNAKDTTLISYTLTDKNGGFKLSGIPSDRATKLIISYIGYNTIRKLLELKSAEAKDFGQLLISGKNLDEVVIKGERSPVVIKKDTIEFNTEAFKTRPNAVVEELLRKLPGVQVNNDGTIEVNGKAISKLLIDGKQFFGSDPKVATKNLDADMIDKIQVYDDRENDPDHKISATKVNKIINLKLKSKIKKSTLGKINGGGGTRDRYEAGGIISNFRDTLQVSLIALGNNLNKTGFTADELYNMGGFGRSGGSQVWDGTFGGRGWGGIESVKSAGFNINNDYGEKLKMNLMYFYTNNVTSSTGNSFEEQTLPETKLTSIANYQGVYDNKKHALSGLAEWKPDTLTRFRYEPKFEYSLDRNTLSSINSSFNSQTPKLNDNTANNTDNGTGRNFGHRFDYYRRLKHKGESININHNLTLNKTLADNYQYSNLTSYISAINSEIQDRYADKDIREHSAGLGFNYTRPLSKKLTTEVNTSTSYSDNSNQLLTYDKSPQSGAYSILLPNQSSELTRLTFIQSIGPQLSYQFNDKLTLRAGINAELQHVKNKFSNDVADIYGKYLNFFPSLKIDGDSYGIGYSQSIELPQIDQMQPITREYGQLYKSIGNPDLKPGRRHNVEANIYKYNHSKQFNINAYTGITISDNNIVQKTTIDANGVTTSTNVNRNGGLRTYFSGNIGKQFKKSQNWQIGLNASVYGNFEHSAFFLNADEGTRNTYYVNLGQGINFNYNELISINTKYNLNNTVTTYQEVDYKSVNTYRHTLSADLSLKWPKSIILDGRYAYSYNPQISQGFQKTANILNLAVSVLMLKKDRGQLKLSVYDLFDQNISVYRYANNNSVNISEGEILKRYFLLNFQYKLNIYKSK